MIKTFGNWLRGTVAGWLIGAKIVFEPDGSGGTKPVIR